MVCRTKIKKIPACFAFENFLLHVVLKLKDLWASFAQYPRVWVQARDLSWTSSCNPQGDCRQFHVYQKRKQDKLCVGGKGKLRRQRNNKSHDFSDVLLLWLPCREEQPAKQKSSQILQDQFFCILVYGTTQTSFQRFVPGRCDHSKKTRFEKKKFDKMHVDHALSEHAKEVRQNACGSRFIRSHSNRKEFLSDVFSKLYLNLLCYSACLIRNSVYPILFYSQKIRSLYLKSPLPLFVRVRDRESPFGDNFVIFDTCVFTQNCSALYL